MALLTHVKSFASLLTVLGIAITLHITTPAAMESLRLRVFDTFQHIEPRHYTPVPVTIIDIDEASLKEYGQWPWSRHLIADLITKLRDAGVASVGLDMVFSETDRTSPSALLPQWSTMFEGIDSQAHYPNYDKELADAIASSPVVTGVVLNDNTSSQPALKAGYVEKGEGNTHDYVTRYQGALVNLPSLTDAASANGAFTAVVDNDGIIRKIPLVFEVGGTLFPSLSMETLRLGLGASTYVINTEAGGIVEIVIGDYIIPTDRHGNLWLYYTQPEPTRYISAKDVMQLNESEDALSGHLTLLGTSAAGLKDLRSTPISNITNGVEIHAQALEQIILGEFLSRPYWIPALELIYIILSVITVWISLIYFTPYKAAIMALILFGITLYASWYSFYAHQLLIDPLTPGIAIIALYIIETLRSYISSERQREKIRHAFNHYMSPALVKKLAENPKTLSLGGEMRDMTVLFCDIRGFTTISEQFDAQGLTQFINRFLTPMTDIILQHHGTIDKYMGDCIMAFWNAPLNDPQHAEHAAQSALEMISSLTILNATLKREAQEQNTPFIPVRIGIGLNTDICCVGNMGSKQRFDYSVLGDGVNLASRLEGQSKSYGMDIVIGEQTYQDIQTFACLELDLIMVKGKTKPTRIYGLLGNAELKQQTLWSDVERAAQHMLSSYRAQRWNEALHHINHLNRHAHALSLDISGLTLLYKNRISAYQKEPPPKEWDGVFIATSK